MLQIIYNIFKNQHIINIIKISRRASLHPNSMNRRTSVHPNSANNDEPSKPSGRKNKVYDLIKREIDARAKRPSVSYTGMFVDKNRNAAITGGDRDLKADVKSKQRRDRLKGDGLRIAMFSYFLSLFDQLLDSSSNQARRMLLMKEIILYSLHKASTRCAQEAWR